MSMEQFRQKVDNEIMSVYGVKRGMLESGADSVLELRIGDICDIIDDKFLEEATSEARNIRLIIEKCPSMSNDLCSLLAKHVSAKIVEIHVVDCPALSWNTHLKKILEGSGAVQVVDLRKNKVCDMCVCVYEYLCMCMCLYVSVCVSVCLSVCACMCICVFVCLYVCAFMCVYLCCPTNPPPPHTHPLPPLSHAHTYTHSG